MCKFFAATMNDKGEMEFKLIERPINRDVIVRANPIALVPNTDPTLARFHEKRNRFELTDKDKH